MGGVWVVKLTARVGSILIFSSNFFCVSSMTCSLIAANWSSVIVSWESVWHCTRYSTRLLAWLVLRETERHTRAVGLYVLSAVLSEFIDGGMGNVALVAILVNVGEANFGVSGVRHDGDDNDGWKSLRGGCDVSVRLYLISGLDLSVGGG